MVFGVRQCHKELDIDLDGLGSLEAVLVEALAGHSLPMGCGLCDLNQLSEKLITLRPVMSPYGKYEKWFS